MHSNLGTSPLQKVTIELILQCILYSFLISKFYTVGGKYKSFEAIIYVLERQCFIVN